LVSLRSALCVVYARSIGALCTVTDCVLVDSYTLPHYVIRVVRSNATYTFRLPFAFFDTHRHTTRGWFTWFTGFCAFATMITARCVYDTVARSVYTRAWITLLTRYTLPFLPPLRLITHLPCVLLHYAFTFIRFGYLRCYRYLWLFTLLFCVCSLRVTVILLRCCVSFLPPAVITCFPFVRAVVA